MIYTRILNLQNKWKNTEIILYTFFPKNKIKLRVREDSLIWQ